MQYRAKKQLCVQHCEREMAVLLNLCASNGHSATVANIIQPHKQGLINEVVGR